MRKAKGKNEWEPNELIATMKDDTHIDKLETITRSCQLKHGTYRIRLGPTPGNYNILGRCGAVVTAWVEVRLGEKLVLPHHEMEGDCHNDSAPVTTEILFIKGTPPAFTTMPQQKFIW